MLFHFYTRCLMPVEALWMLTDYKLFTTPFYMIVSTIPNFYFLWFIFYPRMLGILSKIDPEIDYIGQSFSSKLMNLIFIIGYTIALLTGLILSNLKHTLTIGVATCVMSFLLTVPAWPYFRSHSLKFKKVIKMKNE